MRPSLFALIAAASILGASGHAAHAQQLSQVWSDEFNWIGGIDPTKWFAETGNNNGWGNNELEFYTGNSQNLFTDGSYLNIDALKQSDNGFAYTSARIDTQQSWTYGTFEISAKLPTGRGVWPAIWMLPTNWIYGNGGWPDNGEIDIMEQVGYDPSNVYFHTHNHWTGGGGSGNGINIPTDATQFHVYRLDWAPDHVAGFVDGVQYYYESRNGADWHSWPFDQPFHILINDAIGGNWGGSQKVNGDNGVDNSIFPQDFQIDYVHVSKALSAPYTGAGVAIPGRVEAENYDTGGEGFAYHTSSATNNGGVYRTDGVSIAATSDPGDPGYYVGWMTPDEWLNYTCQTAQAGTYGMTFRLASINDGTSFNVEVDDQRVATVTVPNTGGWDTWQSVQVGGIPLTSGTHRIRILSNSSGWNINRFDVWNPNVTANIKLAPSAFRWNAATKQMLQSITLTNTAAWTINGPIAVAFDSLPAGVSLVGSAGSTTASTPTGSPYALVTLPGNALASGASVTAPVAFSDPSRVSIPEHPRVLTGPAPY